MALFDEDECNFFMRENSYVMFPNEKNPFDLLQDHKIFHDTEIKCSDYMMDLHSNDIETQSNSNSEKKSSPQSTPRDYSNSNDKI